MMIAALSMALAGCTRRATPVPPTAAPATATTAASPTATSTASGAASPLATPTPGDAASPLATPTPPGSAGESPIATPEEPLSDIPAVSNAVADLAARLGVPASDITIVSVEAVEWRDASLGCPQPGMAYAQVITPGYLIVLEAGGASYEYHAGRSQAVLCAQ
jgi:hypothetical protein